MNDASVWSLQLPANFAATRTHLLIPPPAQKSAVHDPCLGTNVTHHDEKTADQGGEMVQPLLRANPFSSKSSIVVDVEPAGTSVESTVKQAFCGR